MNAANTCRVNLFGELQILRSGESVTRFRTHKAASLFAFLAFYLHRVHSRDQLTENFWPDLSPEAGRDNLSTALSSLRRQIEPPGSGAGSLIIADRMNVRLNADVISTDVAEFDELVKSSSRAETPERQVDLLNRALTLYRGELLPGNYDDWAVREQTRYAEIHTDLLSRLCEAQVKTNDLAGAQATYRRIIVADPYQEDAYLSLMKLLAESGNVSGSLEVYAELTRFLKEQLGSKPETAVSSYAEKLRQLQPAGARVRPTIRSATRTLSVSTFVSASSPAEKEAIHQTLTPASAVERRPELPLQLSKFFGRERELEQLSSLLLEESVRLVTLIGPGGAGKTRLSIETAHRLSSELKGRIWFVSLADISDPSLFPITLAQSLKLSAREGDLLESIIEYLGDSRSLLILDNLEHLLVQVGESKEQAVPDDSCLSTIQRLLQQCPALKCFCTSRTALQISGEFLLPLPSLAVPEGDIKLESLLTNESVALYADRARASLQDFAVTEKNAVTIAELCRRLEGIPLAIEMAAGWARTLPPARMLERLEKKLDLLVSRRRDLPARHQSLRAATEWSFELLSSPLKRLFMELSVFRGGFTIEMAEAICGSDALHGIVELQEHSLLIESEAGGDLRYRLLEPLREFAAEKLAEAGQTLLLHQRFTEHLLEEAVRASAGIEGPDSSLWLDRLDAERDNLRYLFGWCLEHDIRSGLQLTAALGRYWELRSHLVEGLRHLLAFLNHPEAAGPSPERIQSLKCAGSLAFLQVDYPLACKLYEEGLQMARQIGDRRGEANCLHGLGNIHFYEQNYESALKCYDEAYAIRLTLQESSPIAASCHSLGNYYVRHNELDKAERFLDEAAAIRRRLGNRQMLAFTLGALGQLARSKGNLEQAMQHSRETLQIFYETGVFWVLSIAFNDLYQLEKALDHLERAAVLSGITQANRHRENHKTPTKELAAAMREQEEIRTSLGKTRYETAYARGYGMTLDEAVVYALQDENA